jgi:hypothetical protein
MKFIFHLNAIYRHVREANIPGMEYTSILMSIIEIAFGELSQSKIPDH